jgi:transitional endoplasmic reticulum ATPase
MARLSFDAEHAANTAVEQHSHRDTSVNPADAARAAILATLDALGGRNTPEDGLLFEGENFKLPARYKNDLEGAERYLRQYRRGQEAETSFIRYFAARPHDGAAAMERAMRRLFGTVGAGIPTQTMFGSNPPRRLDVKVSLTETMSVPWGEIAFEPLNAVFTTAATHNDDGQFVFAVQVTAPKREEKRIRAFFDVVDDEIAKRSIYRGKAIAVRADSNAEPRFIDLSGVDPSKVIYAAPVYRQLSAGLWAPMRYADKLRAQGQTLKTTTLLEGPYGTGKSMAGVLTAQIAVDHGWTYIHVEPGAKIEQALDLARQYGPAVVWIEDVDTVAGGNLDRKRVVKVLEALDGVTTKVPGGLIVGMTTNHVEQLDPAVLRPGRIDVITRVAEPDRPAFEGIVKAVLPGDQSVTLDFDELWAEMGTHTDENGVVQREGMLPAFIVGATQDAVRYAMARSDGNDPSVTTTDILDAARSLRRTFELQQASLKAPKQEDPIESSIARVVERTLENATVVDADGDTNYGLAAFTFKDEIVAQNHRNLARRKKHAE